MGDSLAPVDGGLSFGVAGLLAGRVGLVVV
jgi:hypothetical protein